MNTEHTNSQLNDIFPRSILKNTLIANPLNNKQKYSFLHNVSEEHSIIKFCLLNYAIKHSTLEWSNALDSIVWEETLPCVLFYVLTVCRSS